MSHSRLLRRPLPLAIVLFLLCVWLYTRHNEFPAFYHPDEPDKVTQIIDGKWNFHHPMLMLTTTRVVVDVLQIPRTQQPIVIAGRWISALAAALGVVALAWLGFIVRGPLGFAAVATAAALNHQVYELAHYFKEDAMLFMAISLTFLAVALFWKKKNAGAAALLGLACGLSVSAKYIGGLAFLPALIVLARSRSSTQARSFAVFLAVALAIIAAANFPIVLNLDLFRNSFSREFALAAHGQSGMTRRVPNTQYLRVFADNTNPVTWVLLAVYYATFWRKRATRALPEQLLAVFPIAFAMLLACSPKSNDRYFLPATGLFMVCAGLGALEARRLGVRGAGAMALGLLALAQLIGLTRYDLAFSHDDRRELADWIHANLPAAAVLAQDPRASLQKLQPAVEQRIAATKLTGTSVDELVAGGVTHLVTSESDYGRYFLKSLVPQKAFRDEYEQRRSFYEELSQRAEKIWARPRGTVIYLHPGLELYRLR